jgi:hypothetical protein
VTPGAPPNGTTVHLTMSTASASVPPATSNRNTRPWGTPLLLFAAVAAMFAALTRKRLGISTRRLAYGLCVAATLLGVLMAGCGGGYNNGGGTTGTGGTGTPKGAANFTVVGTAGSATISAPVSVTVQ